MSQFVALLRGVNVGGNKGVPMSRLKAVAEGLSLGNPRTLLQSGNLVFSAKGQTVAALEAALERAIKAEIGVDTAVCVRSAAEWSALIEANPFPDEAKADPSHLLLVAFKTAPDPAGPGKIAASYDGPERIAVARAHAFIVYPDGIGRSKLSNALLSRHLGAGTARNWNTVLKLQAMLQGTDA